MANFIRLSLIKQALGSRFPVDPMSDAGLQELTEALGENEARNTLTQQGFTEADLADFSARLSAETLLFQQWIASNKALNDVLSEGILSEYRDNQGVSEHRLFKDFQAYVSLYLTDKLLHYTHATEPKIRHEVTSFLPLLDLDNRYLVEDQLFRELRKKLAKVEAEWETWRDEEMQKGAVMPLMSDEVIHELNTLSKASYANIMYYVDTLLKTMYAPGTTPRFANWMIKRLELLDLNNEHQEKIRQFKRDLASGTLKVANVRHVKSNNKRLVLPGILILASLGVIFWIVYFKPFSGMDDVEDKNHSSFSVLTEDERREIDSIVKNMSSRAMPEEEAIDQGFLPGGSGILSLRKEFVNPLMEQIYEDHARDGRLTYLYPVDSCGKSDKFVAYQGTKALKGNTGVPATLRNESDYELLVYVADNKKTGSVFTAFVKKGETLSFQMQKGQVITCVAGQSFKRFEVPTGATAEQLPSPGYSHHFCDRDQNFEESINHSYVMYKDVGKLKCVVAGKSAQYIRFIDLTHCTEIY